jgi:hypothetical protein
VLAVKGLKAGFARNPEVRDQMSEVRNSRENLSADL